KQVEEQHRRRRTRYFAWRLLHAVTEGQPLDAPIAEMLSEYDIPNGLRDELAAALDQCVKECTRSSDTPSVIVSTPATSSIVAERLKAIQHTRREQEADEQEWDNRVRQPARLHREKWNATWKAFLSALGASEIDNAATKLHEIGTLIRELDDLIRTR